MICTTCFHYWLHGSLSALGPFRSVHSLLSRCWEPRVRGGLPGNHHIILHSACKARLSHPYTLVVQFHTRPCDSTPFRSLLQLVLPSFLPSNRQQPWDCSKLMLTFLHQSLCRLLHVDRVVRGPTETMQSSAPLQQHGGLAGPAAMTHFVRWCALQGLGHRGEATLIPQFTCHNSIMLDPVQSFLL